jgi:anti-sigma B factor antagonist
MYEFTCQSERIGDSHTEVMCAGELDLHTSRELHDLLHDLVETGATERLVVDLSGCPFVDSTALGVLVMAQRRLQSPINVVCTAPQVCRTLTLTGLDRVFAVYHSREDALASLERQTSWF